MYVATRYGGIAAGWPALILTLIALAQGNMAAGRLDSNTFALNVACMSGVLALFMHFIADADARWSRAMNLATKDPLTGAANRYALENFARQALDQSAKTGEPVTVAVLDCDSFKLLNDNLGHAFGDKVLKCIPSILQPAIEGNGMVGRVGGDEFVVILPKWRHDQAIWMVQRVAKQFHSTTGTMGRASTISFGLSRFPQDGLRYDELLSAADRDLYRRKGAGSEALVCR